ncbi:MAG TPA: glycosyltransferase [Actinomycetota bacterium]|nr:glycosyltransferase [Actinomycetota bacterium]
MTESSLVRIAIDCRWLDSGGAGRTTELMLRALRHSELEVEWLLWGRPALLQAHLWSGARVVPVSPDPRALRGQRSWFDVPDADLTVFLHQQRPLRRVRAFTLIHDTIPLRFGPLAVRRAKRAFLRCVAARSERILTGSRFAARCIVEDLGVDERRITVVRWPGDRELADRVGTLRRTIEPQEAALYLGLLLPHKNVERLLEAFAGTGFRRSGGRLVLTGGSPAGVAALTARLSPEEREFVEVRPFSSQSEVERLLASVRFVVQPSLEEGFGLPAWEALCCGVPVCASTGGSLPEVTRGWADEFDPRSVEEMTEALDRTAMRARNRTPEEAELASAEFLAGTPSMPDLTRQLDEVFAASIPRARAASVPSEPAAG